MNKHFIIFPFPQDGRVSFVAKRLLKYIQSFIDVFVTLNVTIFTIYGLNKLKNTYVIAYVPWF